MKTFYLKVTLAIFLIISFGYHLFPFLFYENPFTEVDFLINYPGASDRHVTFTPVLKSDRTRRIGPTVGVDFGELNFRDCDGDGVYEAVIETDVPFLSESSYYTASRTVLKYERSQSGTPILTIIHREKPDSSYSEDCLQIEPTNQLPEFLGAKR